MDLRLYGRILWRYRVIVVLGLCLGFVLASFSFYSVSTKDGFKLEHRQAEEWASYTTLFVTQQGFPWGWSSIPVETAPQPLPGEKAKTYVPNYADPGRFTSLATLYSVLIRSDRVLSRLPGGVVPPFSSVQAQTVYDPTQTQQLPLIRVTATAQTPEKSLRLVGDVTHAFRAFLSDAQDESNIPEDQRVVVELVNEPGYISPGGAELVQARSPTRPLIIMIAFIVATLGLVFILENLRQTRPPAREARPAEDGDVQAEERARLVATGSRKAQ